MFVRSTLRSAFAALGSAACLGAPAQAQAYPTRPVRFVAPFPPGSGADVRARIYSPKVAQMPDIATALSNQGSEASLLTPAEIAKFVRSELEKWKKVIATAGIKPE